MTATDYGIALQNEIRERDKLRDEVNVEFRRRVYVECLLDQMGDLVRDVCTGKIGGIAAQAKCEEIKRKAKG